MVKKSLYLCILLALGLQWAIPSSAQEAQLTTVSFPKAAAFTSLSDNGLWATAAGVNDDDQSKYAYPCTSLNLVYFKESFPYGVPCFLLMQKTSFHVAKGHVLQRESIPFALLKDVFCVAGLMLLPEPLWRHGHDNTIRHTIQRFFRQTGVSFCGLSARRARCA